MTERAIGLLLLAGVLLVGATWMALQLRVEPAVVVHRSEEAGLVVASRDNGGSGSPSSPATGSRTTASTGSGTADDPASATPTVATAPAGAGRPSLPELEAMAAAGDVAAASLLGRMHWRCAFRTSKGVDELAEAWAQLESAGVSAPKIGGEAVPLPLMIAATAEVEQADAALCEGVVIDRDNWREPTLRWLEQAVDGGDIDAMIDYPQALVRAAPRVDDILAEAEAWRQRRERAARGLATALAAGRPDALWAHAEAYESGFPLPRDPMRALAHVIAWRQVSGAAPNLDRVRGMKGAELRTTLAAAEVAQAERLAQSLAACCGGRR